jgi:murein DD-endopeptidase MepM/ murein hydrolase activator NlpD
LKQHTIIFVPHARAQFRKWRLSTLQAGLILGSLVLLTVSGLTAVALYFDSSFDQQQLERVQQENVDLKAVNQRFETSIHDLEEQLSDYQQRIHQLAIVAGLAELQANGEPGVGGLDPKVEAASGDDDLAGLQIQIQGMGENMELLERHLGERRAMLSSMPTIAPVRGIFTSSYGIRPDPYTRQAAFHHGVDITAPLGRNVLAPGDGVVIKAGQATGYGNTIYLAHGFGVTTRYGHLSKILVRPGQKVHRGDVIAKVGNSGRSTGVHLHYEVRVNGKPENPLGYILDSIRP